MKLNSAKILVSSFLFAGMMAVPGIASAEDPAAVAGCGAGWNLMLVGGAIGSIDWRIYTEDEQTQIELEVTGLDTNEDGHLCVKQWKPNRGQDKQWGATDYIITGIKDNRAQGRLR